MTDRCLPAILRPRGLAYLGGHGMTDRRRGHDDEGFSIVELMTVILILGILVAVAVASYTVTTDASRKVSCGSDGRALRAAILQYGVVHRDVLPDTLEDVH